MATCRYFQRSSVSCLIALDAPAENAKAPFGVRAGAEGVGYGVRH